MTEITTQTIQIHNGDTAIDAYLAIPQVTKSDWGIVVVQEIFGVNAHIQDVTRRFAQQGYVAIAPAIYQRSAPGFQVGYDTEGFQLGVLYKEQTTAEQLLGDIQAAVDYLKSLPHIKKIGTIGFCFGGNVVYLCASLDSIDATASFYGARIVNQRPGGGEPTIAITPQIKGKVYAFFGENDPSIPPEHFEQIESALTKQNPANRVFVYPKAEHGFFCDQRASYNKQAAEDAWSKVLELFS
jgi:carboxymethylenebutenolidase